MIWLTAGVTKANTRTENQPSRWNLDTPIIRTHIVASYGAGLIGDCNYGHLTNVGYPLSHKETQAEYLNMQN